MQKYVAGIARILRYSIIKNGEKSFFFIWFFHLQNAPFEGTLTGVEYSVYIILVMFLCH